MSVDVVVDEYVAIDPPVAANEPVLEPTVLDRIRLLTSLDEGAAEQHGHTNHGGAIFLTAELKEMCRYLGISRNSNKSGLIKAIR